MSALRPLRCRLCRELVVLTDTPVSDAMSALRLLRYRLCRELVVLTGAPRLWRRVRPTATAYAVSCL